MSVTAPSPSPASSAHPGEASPDATEACPLCGAALAGDQDWCLQCGAAARTRLAASPNWGPPAAALAIVVVVSLGVLAASLVKLAGDSGSRPPTITRIVTVPAVASASSPTATQGAGAPGTGAAAGGTATTRSGAGGRHAGTGTAPSLTRTAPAAVLPGQGAGRRAILPAGVRRKGRRVLSPAVEGELRRLREPHGASK